MEGSDLVTGYADVVVSDGFSGNIILKCAEASGLVAKGIVDEMAKRENRSDDPLIKAISHYINQTFNYNARGGATFLGTEKTVIKMHGCAVEDTVVSCIEQLLRLEKAGFREKIKKAMEK
jgi:glycerol-3-phosphate acyltransferase PlsX